MPLDQTTWTEPFLDEDAIAINRAIALLREKGWCTGRQLDQYGRHCLLGAINEALNNSEMHRTPHSDRIFARLASIIAADHPNFVAAPGYGHDWTLANFNNAQTSVEPVIALMERARDEGSFGPESP